MDQWLLDERLAQQYFGNTVLDYVIAVGIFFLALLVLKIIKVVIINRLYAFAEKTKTDIDDFLIGLFKHLGPVAFVLVALYVSTQSLTLDASLERVVQFFFVVVLTYKAVQVVQEIATFFLNRWASQAEEEDPTSAVVVQNLSKIIRITLALAGLLFILDNLGINIASIIAGLGIGGIAVALAAQAVLGDAFAAFAIFTDKPFKVGDFIIVGDMLGTVEHIGFKTTRVRSLSGEQLIFANTDLTGSRIRNYKRMETRRIVFKLGVTYQTSLEQLKAIPKTIESIVGEHELAKFDRAHFQSYGDFALIFETVFYVLSPDYNQYMDVQQFINFRIREEFDKMGIEFAYPTQQIYVTQVDPPEGIPGS